MQWVRIFLLYFFLRLPVATTSRLQGPSSGASTAQWLGGKHFIQYLQYVAVEMTSGSHRHPTGSHSNKTADTNLTKATNIPNLVGKLRGQWILRNHESSFLAGRKNETVESLTSLTHTLTQKERGDGKLVLEGVRRGDSSERRAKTTLNILNLLARSGHGRPYSWLRMCLLQMWLGHAKSCFVSLLTDFERRRLPPRITGQWRAHRVGNFMKVLAALKRMEAQKTSRRKHKLPILQSKQIHVHMNDKTDAEEHQPGMPGKVAQKPDIITLLTTLYTGNFHPNPLHTHSSSSNFNSNPALTAAISTNHVDMPTSQQHNSHNNSSITTSMPTTSAGRHLSTEMNVRNGILSTEHILGNVSSLIELKMDNSSSSTELKMDNSSSSTELKMDNSSSLTELEMDNSSSLTELEMDNSSSLTEAYNLTGHTNLDLLQLHPPTYLTKLEKSDKVNTYEWIVNNSTSRNLLPDVGAEVDSTQLRSRGENRKARSTNPTKKPFRDLTPQLYQIMLDLQDLDRAFDVGRRPMRMQSYKRELLHNSKSASRRHIAKRFAVKGRKKHNRQLRQAVNSAAAQLTQSLLAGNDARLNATDAREPVHGEETSRQTRPLSRHARTVPIELKTVLEMEMTGADGLDDIPEPSKNDFPTNKDIDHSIDKIIERNRVHIEDLRLDTEFPDLVRKRRSTLKVKRDLNLHKYKTTPLDFLAKLTIPEGEDALMFSEPSISGADYYTKVNFSYTREPLQYKNITSEFTIEYKEGVPKKINIKIEESLPIRPTPKPKIPGYDDDNRKAVSNGLADTSLEEIEPRISSALMRNHLQNALDQLT